MKNTLLFSLFTTAMLAAGVASAGGSNLFGGEGSGHASEGTMYGGASMGKSDAICAKTNEEDCDNNGWKVFGGYKFTDMLGVEGGYYHLGTAEKKGVAFSDAVTGVSGTTDMDVSATGLGVAGVVSLPVVDNIDVFAKVGVMKWQAEAELKNAVSSSGTSLPTVTDSVEGTDLMYGVGAGYQFTDNWGVRGEYEAVGGDLDSKTYSVGATFSTL